MVPMTRDYYTDKAKEWCCTREQAKLRCFQEMYGCNSAVLCKEVLRTIDKFNEAFPEYARVAALEMRALTLLQGERQMKPYNLIKDVGHDLRNRGLDAGAANIYFDKFPRLIHQMFVERWPVSKIADNIEHWLRVRSQDLGMPQHSRPLPKIRNREVFRARTLYGPGTPTGGEFQ
jgi:hypothetical protein